MRTRALDEQLLQELGGGFALDREAAARDLHRLLQELKVGACTRRKRQQVA
jgi:hypothetical protein